MSASHVYGTPRVALYGTPFGTAVPSRLRATNLTGDVTWCDIEPLPYQQLTLVVARHGRRRA
jgi:hypothetical protein